MTATPPDDGGFHPTKAKPTKAGGGKGWFGGIAIVLLILVAVGVLFFIRAGGDDSGGSGDPPQGGDHWHAAFGINLCGNFLPDIPAFEFRSGSTDEKAGIHSHGDGLIHIHPLAPDETGSNATVGRYLEYAGGSLNEDSIELADQAGVANGDPCPDGRPGVVRWSVNGEEQDGNPADFKPEDLDVVVIGFLPEGDDLGTPASVAVVENPSDV